MDWKKLAIKGASILYGLLNLAVFAALAALDGSLFRKPSDKAKRELAAARHRLWSLSAPPNGIKHRFYHTNSGTKLHYVTAEPVNSSARNLIIFLHGFPDSWAMWRYHLSSTKLSSDATLLALDLPGFGGSDGLPKYDATNVLETVTTFILDMKAEYMSKADSPTEKGKVILVCHDWGSVIGFRLASEAPQVADRFILASAVHPALAVANIKTRWTTVVQMLRTWKHKPRSIKLLKKAASNLKPLLTQLKKSGYIFVFNLPSPIANAFGSFGNYWFMRLMHELAAEGKRYPPESKEAAEMMASSFGPSIEECSSHVSEKVNGDAKVNGDTLEYPADVKRRAADGGWSTKIRYYREGLITKPWAQSMETLWDLAQEEQSASLAKRRRSSAGAALFESGPDGALKAKVTVLWGSKDPAGEARVALEGIEDYMSRGSQVLVLEGTGHWMPLEKNGRVVIEEVVKWAVDGEVRKMKDVVAQEGLGVVKVMAER